MQGSSAKLNIVILDACRNNPFAGRGLRAVGGGLAQMQAPEGTLISYATQPKDIASDGKGPDSPYTTALTQAMVKPGLNLFQTFNEAANNVKDATGKSQKPWMSASPISGDFYFAGPPSQAAFSQQPVRTNTPSVEDAEIIFWKAIQNSRDPEDFAAYLKQYPNGRFVALARVRRVQLSGTKPSASPTPAAPKEVVANSALLPPRSQVSPWSPPSPVVPPKRAKQLVLRETPSMARAMPNVSLSETLSHYLHSNRLPYVDALVLSDQSGETNSLVLSGRV